MATLLVEIAAGELIDKITILDIKREHIGDPGKLRNVQAELDTLRAAQAKCLAASPELDRLTTELKAVNLALWHIEDKIREQERAKNFGSVFIELARSVYLTNDRRA